MRANLLGRVCAHLGDARRAQTLYDMLRPYSGRMVVTRPFVVFGPPNDLTLASLAITLSQHDQADAHFAAALTTLQRMRGSQWQADLAYRRADFLWRRGREGDADRALALLDDAESLARSIGMTVLTEWIERRRSEIRESSGSARPRDGVDRSADGPTGGTFRRSGAAWILGLDSRTAQFRDMRGLGYIARLLAEPGHEIHVLDLTAAGQREVEASTRGDSGEHLDATARASYEARLREADGELDEAERMNDRGRVEALRHEIELLTAELSRGFGLGGRTRRAGSSQERARVAVTRAIKYAIDKIETQDPALAEHLRACVHTGTFVSYRPSSRDPVHWAL
jgi:hypothetical protein